MKYKAVIFDIDGTAVSNEQHAKPSKLLIETIEKAKNKTHICAATGRIYATAKWVIDPLKLVDPCIISSGAEIIDPTSGKILWQKSIPKDAVKNILQITSLYPYEMTVASQYVTYPPQKRLMLQDENIIYVKEIPIKQSISLIKKLRNIKNIVVYSAPDYQKGKITLNITHKDATKEKALGILTEMLGIRKEEIIAVGDGENDLPLFASAKLKIALDNATEQLKRSADVIAPSVDKDGLAYIIQEYILS